MHHRHDRLEALQLVPLIPLDRQLVLPCGERPDVPCNIIAPSNRLHPMHAPCVHPDQIPRSLQEAVDGYIRLVEVLQCRPPRAVEVVDLVLLTEGANGAPVGVWYCKPLAVSRANVDVYRAEVVVLLMAGSSASGDLAEK